MQRFGLILICGVLCAGCAQFPHLDGTISPDVQDEDFVPFIELDDMAQPAPAPNLAEDPLTARAEALSRRADALRSRSVIPPDVRARAGG